MIMDSRFFIQNRNKLVEKLEGGLIVLSAYSALQRSNDSSHRFTQEANFWYLCGIEDPDWTLIIDGSAMYSWLVKPDVDEVHRIFDGGISAEEALEASGVDRVIDTHEATVLLRKLATKHSIAYSIDQHPHAEYFNFALNPAMSKNWASLERIFNKVQNCRKELALLRAIKQPIELKMITKAVKITIDAFEVVHAKMGSYKNEYEIDADFSREVRFAGASGCAYDSIVAAGINACTLHYSQNGGSIKNRQLVLMDMGAQFAGYAADVSRTYVKGEPTKRQYEVHAAVETAHHRIISLIEPMLSVESYQRSVNDIMSESLASIGLVSDEAGLRKYFPHAISHGLGIDVHDSLGGPKYFVENMVLTVEPGIYIPEESIGVRIEDDILVTKSGRTNLSAQLSTGL